jgi:hypothetical protein
MEKVLTEATQPIWSFLAGLKKNGSADMERGGAPACQRPTRCSDSAASWRVNRTQGGGLSTVEKFAAIGVDEIACLIDFGIDYGSTMDGLKHLAGLADLISAAGRRKPVPASARF